jgi:hypothetical protein
MQLVACLYTLRYYILNIVKCNVHTFFVVIWMMFVQASPLRHLTKFRLYVVLLEAPENAQGERALLTLCVDASLIPMCRTNAPVHSLGKRVWPVMSVCLLWTKYFKWQSRRSTYLGGEGERHIPACSSMLRNCSESSDPVNGRRVSLSISKSQDWWNKLLVILSPLSTSHTHKTECTLDLGHNWCACLGPYQMLVWQQYK